MSTHQLERLSALVHEAYEITSSMHREPSPSADIAEDCERITRITSAGVEANELCRLLLALGRSAVDEAYAHGMAKPTLVAIVDTAHRSVRCLCANCTAKTPTPTPGAS